MVYTYNATVTKILDGDTIDVDIDLGFDVILKQRVRIYGINTPEIHSKDEDEKERGFLSKKRVIELLPFGTKILLKSKNYDPREKFGRVLADIIIVDSNVNVGRLLVDEGLAKPYFGEKKVVDVNI